MALDTLTVAVSVTAVFRISFTKGALAGITSGMASMVAHAGGPPVAMYLLLLALTLPAIPLGIWMRLAAARAAQIAAALSRLLHGARRGCAQAPVGQARGLSETVTRRRVTWRTSRITCQSSPNLKAGRSHDAAPSGQLRLHVGGKLLRTARLHPEAGIGETLHQHGCL